MFMKKVISLLLVLVCCLSLCACGEEAPSPEVQLKTKTEYIFLHYPDKEQYSQTEINSVINTVYEYNETNQLVSSHTDYNSSLRMGYTETYSYEDGKTMSGEVVGYYSTDSDAEFKQTNEYDKYGNITFSEKRYTDGFRKGSRYDSTYQYTYGKNGEILTKKSYTDGELDSTTVYEYEYNEKGLPAKSTETVTSGDNETVWINTFVYDNNGNLIVETCEVADIQGQRTSIWSSTQIVYTYG